MKNKLLDLLQNRQYAILTAENPNNTPLSQDENLDLNFQLIWDLCQADLDYIRVQGNYGGDTLENSYLIFDITAEYALELCKKYNQESVMTHEGLLFQDGTLYPATGIIISDELTKNFSIIKIDGVYIKFSITIDFKQGGFSMKVQCENCETVFDEDDILYKLEDITNLALRIEPGDVVPYGECPECDSLVYLLENYATELDLQDAARDTLDNV